jgi:VWFA-related protein
MFLMARLFLLLLALRAGCPQQQQQEDPVFKAGVAVVRVDAQVVQERRPILGLEKGDFVVSDNGVAVPVEYFGRDSERLWVVLLIDVSGSMSRYVSDMARVSREALSQLGGEDQVALILFGAKSKVDTAFTGSKERVSEAIGRATRERTMSAGSSVNLAVTDAAALVREATAGKPGRRAVIIVTDNGGLNYQSPDDAALDALFGADAVLNAIVTPNAKPPSTRGRNPDFSPPDVFLLARESGGEVLHMEKGGEALREMLDRVRTRYSLHYGAPADAKPGMKRKISVRLSAQAHKRYPRAEVRARSGYSVPN